MELPKHIFETAAAMPPTPTTCAERISPFLIAPNRAEYFFSASAHTGARESSLSISIIATLEPAFLNSGEITFSTLHGTIAKLTRVGGTSILLKEPDIESLPPMAAAPSPICASYAPSSAARGLPQRLGSLRSFSKYSWKVSLMRVTSPPEAAIFAKDSSTAYIAPW